jgi:hypothetical protein
MGRRERIHYTEADKAPSRGPAGGGHLPSPPKVGTKEHSQKPHASCLACGQWAAQNPMR